MNPAIRETSERTFDVAVRVLGLSKKLKTDYQVPDPIIRQLLRSGTAIGANVEEAQGAESVSDFVHKFRIALKEARETHYWLRLLVAAELVPRNRLELLINEVEQITKILGASIRTAVNNKKTATKTK